ncbi:MAG: PAS domain S-box protein [Dehalococcoidia bacterium]
MTTSWQRHLLEDVRELGVIGVEREGRIVEWSGGAAEITGTRATTAVGGLLSEVWAPEPEVELERVLSDAAERGGITGERLYLRDSGDSFWAEESITPVRGDENVLGFSVIIRDVTARKRAMDDLMVSQATFEGILAIASDAVVCVTEDQQITFFNRGAEGMFGYSPAEVLGQPLEILIPEPHRPDHAEHVRRFARSGVAARQMGERGEITGRRKDGEVFPAEASISQLTVGGSRIFTAVLRDVSERRRTEESLAEKARELERSNAELEQFAYVASHDLQEPLRMVASYTQLLARRYQGKLDDDADEFVGYVVDGVNRMQALISDLLAYSRVGTRGGEFEEVSMEIALKGVLRGLGPAIEETSAVVTNDPLPVVEGDTTQLSQLLQNLIANALKFRGDEPPRVHVSARAEGSEWVFAVRDEGIGIDPKFQERIFVIFQRLHSRGEYPGTGIGLAICRKIVERHGGGIWVESSPGEGATFFFTLPS